MRASGKFLLSQYLAVADNLNSLSPSNGLRPNSCHSKMLEVREPLRQAILPIYSSCSVSEVSKDQRLYDLLKL